MANGLELFGKVAPFDEKSWAPIKRGEFQGQMIMRGSVTADALAARDARCNVNHQRAISNARIEFIKGHSAIFGQIFLPHSPIVSEICESKWNGLSLELENESSQDIRVHDASLAVAWINRIPAVAICINDTLPCFRSCWVMSAGPAAAQRMRDEEHVFLTSTLGANYRTNVHRSIWQMPLQSADNEAKLRAADPERGDAPTWRDLLMAGGFYC
jgi:hypothetical protein